MRRKEKRKGDGKKWVAGRGVGLERRVDWRETIGKKERRNTCGGHPSSGGRSVGSISRRIVNDLQESLENASAHSLGYFTASTNHRMTKSLSTGG